MIKQLRTFWSLDANSRCLLIQLMVYLPFSILSIQFLGLKQSNRLLSLLIPANQRLLDADQTRLMITRTLRMLDLTSRYFASASCLIKSLVLWRLLLNQGIACDLQFGVKRGETKDFNAHAWVEYQGFILNDRTDIRDLFLTFNHPINSKL